MENKVYFGLAMSDSMFPSDCLVKREPLTLEALKALLVEGNVEVCLNSSHAATITAMEVKYGITVAVPAAPPKVALSKGDKLALFSVRGLPRLTDRHEYTEEEIASSTFVFGLWTVM